MGTAKRLWCECWDKPHSGAGFVGIKLYTGSPGCPYARTQRCKVGNWNWRHAGQWSGDEGEKTAYIGSVGALRMPAAAV